MNNNSYPGFLRIFDAIHLLAFGNITDTSRNKIDKVDRAEATKRGRPNRPHGYYTEIRLRWAVRQLERAGREDRITTFARRKNAMKDKPRIQLGVIDCWWDRRIDLIGDDMKCSLALKPTEGTLWNWQNVARNDDTDFVDVLVKQSDVEQILKLTPHPSKPGNATSKFMISQKPPPTAPSKRSPPSKQNVREWYAYRHAKWPQGEQQPSREQDAADYRNHFEQETVSREWLREFRKEIAPEWTKSGAPKQSGA